MAEDVDLMKTEKRSKRKKSLPRAGKSVGEIEALLSTSAQARVI